MKKSVFIMFVAIILIVLPACGGMETTTGNAKRTDPIIFADAGWDSIRFHNGVARFIIENGYGYKTDVTVGSTPATLQGLGSGEINAYMEIWTDNMLDKYNEMIKSGDIVELSVNFDDNAQGLYVPTYVIKGDPARGIKPVAPDLKSVEDLPKYWEVFKDPENPSKGRIYGSPPGWDVDNKLTVKMETYKLNESYNYFRPGSDAALASSIAAAYEKGLPWVGYYWDPTWITGKFDLTLLKEPEFSEERWENGYASEFPSNRVVVAAHKDLIQGAPDVVAFLKNYKTNSKLTSEALAYMQDNEASAEDAAKWFIQKHPEVWTPWVPKEIADKVKKAL